MDQAMPVGCLTHSMVCPVCLLSLGQQCQCVRQVPFQPILEAQCCFYLHLSEKSAFPNAEKLVLLLKRVKNPLSPPIHSAHCLCRDLLRLVEDVLLYITQMQLNSMGEGEGHRVQTPAFSVFLLIYCVTQGRQLCAAISFRKQGHWSLGLVKPLRDSWMTSSAGESKPLLLQLI